MLSAGGMNTWSNIQPTGWEPQYKTMREPFPSALDWNGWAGPTTMNYSNGYNYNSLSGPMDFSTLLSVSNDVIVSDHLPPQSQTVWSESGAVELQYTAPTSFTANMVNNSLAYALSYHNTPGST